MRAATDVWGMSRAMGGRAFPLLWRPHIGASVQVYLVRINGERLGTGRLN
jgi:hypothetical protein